MPYINKNLPQVYMCSPSWIPLPPPSLYHSSGSSQCISPEHPVSCIEPGLDIQFLYDNIHVSMPFSQIIPPSPSPTESKRLCLFCCLAYKVIVTIFLNSIYRDSGQFSLSVMSNSLRPHESQHARPPCPSPTPRVHSDSHPLSHWCHPAISSLVVPFSSCPQSLPASESFPMSQLFAWGGQSTGVSVFLIPIFTKYMFTIHWVYWALSDSNSSLGDSFR